MNAKKCPKCGENNPAQAVMCWACYSPFMAASADGLAPVGSAVPVAADDGSSSGPSVPAWAYMLIGTVLTIVVFMGAKYVVSGGTEVNPIVPDTPTTSTNPPGTVNTPRSPDSGPSTPGQAPEIPFNLMVSPNEQAPVGVLAIVPKQQVSPTQAANVARFASNLWGQGKGHQWSRLQVYVFNDVETGNHFKDMQVRRKNWPLGADDFNSIPEVWPNTEAVCVFDRGRLAKVVYPQRDPYNFWHDLV